MELTTLAPSILKSFCRVTMMLGLFGKGRFIESKVFRPIIMWCPMVSDLKCFKSSGQCQGKVLLMPMVRFFAIATIMEMRVGVVKL